MENDMFVSVAICTWNRADLLDQTLTSMYKLIIPPETVWELMIVNNNCTDTTDSVIAKHQANLPIRRLFEPQQGKSFALNCACRAAKGEFIIWTDDDVLVETDWLARYVEAFKQWPNSSVFGGPVKPFLAGTPPQWLLDQNIFSRVANVYAAIDLGPEPIDLTQGKEPYGTNWAVRTKDQRKYLYDTNLGPAPNRRIYYEDTDVIRRMFADGLNGRWVPNALLNHYIPENRQSTKYIRRYFRGQGEYTALQRSGKNKYPLYEEKLRFIKRIIVAELKYLIYRFIIKNPKIWINALIQSSYVRGQLSRK
jgi:glycosyltransferase involved in cell wall biosynthesis